MTSYSQYGEDKILVELFGSKVGRLLEIGAYHPTTFSNSRALIEAGWEAVLIEPSPACMCSLLREYGRNEKIHLICAAVYPEALAQMHVTDDAVSTTETANYETWKNAAAFDGQMWAGTITVPELMNQFGAFDFVSVDTEGTSVPLAISLLNAGMRPQVLMVEHDGRMVELMQAAQVHGYRCHNLNGTNAILVRP